MSGRERPCWDYYDPGELADSIAIWAGQPVYEMPSNLFERWTWTRGDLTVSMYVDQFELEMMTHRTAADMRMTSWPVNFATADLLGRILADAGHDPHRRPVQRAGRSLHQCHRYGNGIPRLGEPRKYKAARLPYAIDAPTSKSRDAWLFEHVQAEGRP